MIRPITDENIKIVLIEFNEVNFELVKQYLDHEIDPLRWANLRNLLKFKNLKTSSEDKYHNLEPWIQWVSVHTGLEASEHEVFRLGDISNSNCAQIFEILEQNGASVGSISAMNAENRLKNPCYFIPDPWTVSSTDGSFTSKAVYSALHQAVNDNSVGKLTLSTLVNLFIALILHSKVSNWHRYIRLFMKALNKQRWNKALFLDLFMSDLHLSLMQKNKPQFSTLFLNGFAHLQHHYFFSSKYYRGSQKNPKWYLRDGLDPFIDALDVYDRIIGQQIDDNPGYEILVATGLQQVPYKQTSFYYRLLDHTNFLSWLGISNVKVLPRMTRDFLIECESEAHAKEIEQKLSIVELNGHKFFADVDNRGKSLFVTLTYDAEITDKDEIRLADGTTVKVLENVVFVAIKNGMHDATGYVFSSKPGTTFGSMSGKHVKNLFHYIMQRVINIG